MTFERSLERLDDIVTELEEGDIELERALALFEEGVSHLRVANGALKQLDARVQELTEAADGSFTVSELDL